ncbi:hypothetical protein Anas_12983, partial [Armadillidium nasatum]
MDIKSEIEIKVEHFESTEDVRNNGQIIEKVSLLEETQKKNFYSNIKVKDEIEIKDEPLDTNEDYNENGEDFDHASGEDLDHASEFG